MSTTMTYFQNAVRVLVEEASTTSVYNPRWSRDRTRGGVEYDSFTLVQGDWDEWPGQVCRAAERKLRRMNAAAARAAERRDPYAGSELVWTSSS